MGNQRQAVNRAWWQLFHRLSLLPYFHKNPTLFSQLVTLGFQLLECPSCEQHAHQVWQGIQKSFKSPADQLVQLHNNINQKLKKSTWSQSLTVYEDILLSTAQSTQQPKINYTVLVNYYCQLLFEIAKYLSKANYPLLEKFTQQMAFLFSHPSFLRPLEPLKINIHSQDPAKATYDYYLLLLQRTTSASTSTSRSKLPSYQTIFSPPLLSNQTLSKSKKTKKKGCRSCQARREAALAAKKSVPKTTLLGPATTKPTSRPLVTNRSAPTQSKLKFTPPTTSKSTIQSPQLLYTRPITSKSIIQSSLSDESKVQQRPMAIQREQEKQIVPSDSRGKLISPPSQKVSFKNKPQTSLFKNISLDPAPKRFVTQHEPNIKQLLPRTNYIKSGVRVAPFRIVPLSGSDINTHRSDINTHRSDINTHRSDINTHRLSNRLPPSRRFRTFQS